MSVGIRSGSGQIQHGDQITSLTVIMTEITDQEEAETVLRAREELYRLLSTITADYVFSTQIEADGQLRPKWVGGAFESITGYSFEEFIARGGWLANLHPDDRKKDAREVEPLYMPIETSSAKCGPSIKAAICAGCECMRIHFGIANRTG